MATAPVLLLDAMSPSLLVVGCAVLGAAASVGASSCPALVVDASAPIHETAPYFASWNVDASRDRLFFDVDWTNPQLVYLATQIGAPGNIRFGGTGVRG